MRNLCIMVYETVFVTASLTLKACLYGLGSSLRVSVEDSRSPFVPDLDHHARTCPGWRLCAQRKFGQENLLLLPYAVQLFHVEFKAFKETPSRSLFHLQK